MYDAGGPIAQPATPPPRPSQTAIAKACGVTAAGLLGILVERAGVVGSFVATMADLAADLGYSDRRVRQLVASLETAGFLSRETATGPGGLATGVRFTIPENLRVSYPEIGFTHESTPETTPEISCGGRGAPREPGLGSSFVPNGTHSAEKNDERENSPSDSPKKTKKPKPTRWPDGFALTDDLRRYAVEQAGIRPDRVEAVFDGFHDKALAKGYEYVDWVRAWQTWVRSPYQDRDRGPAELNGHANGAMPGPAEFYGLNPKSTDYLGSAGRKKWDAELAERAAIYQAALNGGAK